LVGENQIGNTKTEEQYTPEQTTTPQQQLTNQGLTPESADDHYATLPKPDSNRIKTEKTPVKLNNKKDSSDM